MGEIWQGRGQQIPALAESVRRVSADRKFPGVTAGLIAEKDWKEEQGKSKTDPGM